MKNVFLHYIRFLPLFVLLISSRLQAQEADNEFKIDAKIFTRGELRYGGFRPDAEDNERMSHFLMGQYRLNIGYQRSWLEIQLSPKWSGIWGQSGGSLSLAEAWVKMWTKHGLFAKIGRQELEYDDERVLGYDDWTMTAPTHDVLKFGYEGHGHKVHAILAYNQNPENTSSGTSYYSGGIQPYKTMQTIWYHYDTPKNIFGISLMAMNIGMQNSDPQNPKTLYQQLYGTYLTLKPKYVSVEGAFYYQSGTEEHGLPLAAYMGAAKITATPNDISSIHIGYDYLSGDKYFAVLPDGAFGMVHHDKVRGFSALFGAHHNFYGAMDFFYLNSYVGGFTPGLQNLYAGGSVNPVKKLNINAAYHFLAIATNLQDMKKPLGHELELSASYKFVPFVSLSAGYSFMIGTETMLKLQHVTETRRLHWAWIMLNVSPTIFQTSWQDKAKRKKGE